MLNVSLVNLLCIVVNLLILLALMKKFLYQPVLNVIEERQKMMAGKFQEAEEAQKEAGRLKEQYESCLADAKAEQENMIKEAKIQAGIEYDRILADADKQSKQIVAEAKKRGLDEREKTVKDAEQEIARMAVAAVAKIVAQSSDEKNDYVIYDEFLKKAGEKSGTNSN